MFERLKTWVNKLLDPEPIIYKCPNCGGKLVSDGIDKPVYCADCDKTYLTSSEADATPMGGFEYETFLTGEYYHGPPAHN